MSKQWWQLISAMSIAIAVVGCSKIQPQVTPVNSTNPLPAPKNVWMTEFHQLNGTPYFYAPIYVADREQKSILKQIKSAASDYGREWEYGAIDIRNYMFVNRDSLSAVKLLSNNNSRLIELKQIGESFPPDKSGKYPERINSIKSVKTLWYVQVLADTNGDKILSNLDRQQIAISDVSGANYTELIKDIDKILLVSAKGLDRRLVFYTSGQKHFVADVDLSKRQATIKELPALI
jgi:hypothetical protein